MKKEYDSNTLKKRSTKPKTDKSANKVPISLRLDGGVLSILKDEASRQGIPYQTFISSILHKFATGELVDKKLLDIFKNFKVSS